MSIKKYVFKPIWWQLPMCSKGSCTYEKLARRIWTLAPFRCSSSLYNPAIVWTLDDIFNPCLNMLSVEQMMMQWFGIISKSPIFWWWYISTSPILWWWWSYCKPVLWWWRRYRPCKRSKSASEGSVCAVRCPSQGTFTSFSRNCHHNRYTKYENLISTVSADMASR